MIGRFRQFSVIPGFGMTMGVTVLYLALLVLIPLGAMGMTAAGLTWAQFWRAVSDPQAVAAYKLSLGASLAGATLNVVFGGLVAWVLVRYRFPGRRFLDAMVDLPFALPTAVAGIALAAIYSPKGWVGQLVDPLGLKIAFTPIGIIITLTFIGMPFVVRTVQPVLEELDKQLEEAAASLGAKRRQTAWRVIAPELYPALLTGFALAFARGLGEYGSVIFIAGNLPMKTEIVPLLIFTKLEQYDYGGATALAVVMLAVSFGMLLLINVIQEWSRRRHSVERPSAVKGH